MTDTVLKLPAVMVSRETFSADVEAANNEVALWAYTTAKSVSILDGMGRTLQTVVPHNNDILMSHYPDRIDFYAGVDNGKEYRMSLTVGATIYLENVVSVRYHRDGPYWVWTLHTNMGISYEVKR